MRQKPVIVFDLDGTLWDTREVCAKAWNIALGRWTGRTQRFSIDDIGGVMGLSAEELRLKFFDDLPLKDGQNLLRDCLNEEVTQIYKGGAKLFPCVKELLPIFYSKADLFIASNCEHDYLEAFLSVTGLRTFFKDWESHGRTRLTKGENVKLLLRRNAFSEEAGVEKRFEVLVGDTSSDELAAQVSRVSFCYAAYGFGKPRAWDYRIDSFEQLLWTLPLGDVEDASQNTENI